MTKKRFTLRRTLQDPPEAQTKLANRLVQARQEQRVEDPFADMEVSFTTIGEDGDNRIGFWDHELSDVAIAAPGENIMHFYELPERTVFFRTLRRSDGLYVKLNGGCVPYPREDRPLIGHPMHAHAVVTSIRQLEDAELRRETRTHPLMQDSIPEPKPVPKRKYPRLSLLLGCLGMLCAFAAILAPPAVHAAILFIAGFVVIGLAPPYLINCFVLKDSESLTYVGWGILLVIIGQVAKVILQP